MSDSWCILKTFHRIADNIFSPIILWFYRSGRNDGCPIMLSHFLIRTVKYKFRTCILNNAGLKIIRHKNTGYTTEEGIRMYMSLYPMIGIVHDWKFQEPVDLAVGAWYTYKNYSFYLWGNDFFKENPRVTVAVDFTF